MTMIAGGDDGSEKAARVLARRPTIRPRPVTPPRSAAPTPAPAKALTWKLPPVRLPSPRIAETGAEARAAARPVLLLVADASDQFEIARRHESADAAPHRLRWRSLRTVATVAAVAIVALSVVALAGAAVVATSASSHPSGTPAPRVATRTIAQATPGPPAAKAPEPASPVIPLIDVKSLPPAPRSR